MPDTPYTMVHPDLAGELEARDRRRPGRARADRQVTVHWLDERGQIAKSTEETLPHHMLAGLEGLADADEVWWHADGSVSPWPPRRLKRGDKEAGDKTHAGDPEAD